MSSVVTNRDAVIVETPSVGYFGKYPGYPDFVQNALPASLVGVWRDWTAEFMAAGTSEFGDEWLEIYLHSPVWRFCLFDDDFVGTEDGGWAGAVMPSLDSRGRYFPMLVAAPVPPAPSLALLRGSQPFFDQLEARLIRCLSEPTLDHTKLPEHFVTELPSLKLSQPVGTSMHASLEDDAAALSVLDDVLARHRCRISWWQAANVASGEGRLHAYPGQPVATEFAAVQGSTVSIVKEQEEDVSA